MVFSWPKNLWVFLSSQIVLFLLTFGLFPPNQSWAEDETSLVTAIEQVAKNVGPTVVSIRIDKVARYRSYQGYTGDPFYDDFFTQFFGDSFENYPEYEQHRSGLGSGVIIDAQGFILTNAHVIRGADKITVTLSDRRSFNAELKGIDPRSDLAVIKIAAPDLPVANLGNSDELKIGQWVVAIGNPFGHILDNPEPTVTQGVISALHRALPVTSRQDTDYSDLIQTDAAINPGNSGGPLVNLKGEIVGINVAIFSTSGGYQGIGFAIPANYAKAIVEQISKGRKIDLGWIGVGIQDLDSRLSQYFGLESAEGVIINQVVNDSPAQKAGLKEGDIILSSDGIRIRNTTTLIKYIAATEIGKTINFQVIRDRKKSELPVIVGKRPDLGFPATTENTVQSPPPLQLKHWRGMEIRDIPKSSNEFRQLSTTGGIIVSQVEPNSAADEAGIRPGDIIVSVNKKRIRDVQDFQLLIKDNLGNYLLQTLRGHFVIEDDGASRNQGN
jgi:serine protease Do